MTTATALASSSKRTLPSSSTPASKRAKPAPPSTFDGSDDEEDELDDSARAKSERKAARIIRNRESAQRSRNQRKAHLVFLEQRVRELEEENRSLKDSSTRAGSPAVSVSLPLFSGGINLATVAPPPSDIEVKVDFSALQSENVALRERVGLLENLVKQVVALSTFNAAPAPPVEQVEAPVDSTPIDWDALFTTQLAPPEPPVASVDLTSTLARHPAVVATASPDASLQRARTLAIDLNSPQTKARIRQVARVVVLMARLRGLTRPLPMTLPCGREARRWKRDWRRTGMRG